MDIKSLVKSQRDFFITGQTRDLDFRIRALKTLETMIAENEEKIYQALYDDLSKSKTEAYTTEIGLVLEEIDYFIKNLPKLAKRKRVRTPLLAFPARSYIYKEPYGLSLIISPWNYPFQLSLMPLIGSMASGNCAILKTSEKAPKTAYLIRDLVGAYFDPSYISTVEGGKEANQAVLEEKFDYIFFTGSVKVGKIVMEKASKNLTPISLELGGKSPCIVTKNTDLDLAAKRSVWGKLINAGQTCIAPDYFLVEEGLTDEFIERSIRYIEEFYGRDPISNPTYPKIISKEDFEKKLALTKEGDLAYGGTYDRETRKIAPTILINPREDSDLMEEEIFGPIMPIKTYKTFDEALAYIKTKGKPLALYMFSDSKEEVDRLTEEISFGGGCINDTLMHFSNHLLPFGGVGPSGMGRYHGSYSFDTFSHSKAVMAKASFLDPELRYHPYSEKKHWLIKKLLG